MVVDPAEIPVTRPVELLTVATIVFELVKVRDPVPLLPDIETVAVLPMFKVEAVTEIEIVWEWDATVSV